MSLVLVSRLDVFEALGAGGWLEGLPRMQAWRDALAQRPCSELARRIAAAA